jgi:hypothetical protein
MLFVDMDGVLADFDTGHERLTGVRSDKLLDNADWKAVEADKMFYAKLPPMPDLHVLWSYVRRYRPTVLTGLPKTVQGAEHQKRAWIATYIGPDVPVICCASKDKCLYAMPGDILIDDWEKYQHLWVAKGGAWITHRSAEDTITQLKAMGL